MGAAGQKRLKNTDLEGKQEYKYVIWTRNNVHSNSVNTNQRQNEQIFYTFGPKWLIHNISLHGYNNFTVIAKNIDGSMKYAL